MANKMLIDAAHPEETRVTVVRGNRVEEFDFEAANRRQLRGNIYLARVTRVEPSLQAAFVEYGGNRHGFLAFSEIHPDYYQLPKADREELERQLAEEAEANRRERERREKEEAERAKAAGIEEENSEDSEEDESKLAEELDAAYLASLDAPYDDDHGVEDIGAGSASDDDEPAPTKKPRRRGRRSKKEIAAAEEAAKEEAEDKSKSIAAEASIEAVVAEQISEEIESDSDEDEKAETEATSKASNESNDNDNDEEDEGEVRSEARIRRLRDRYKIQEVIKRRQLLLVQVVKEERGNKGAALTTYLSLAGRYSVLMPNTDRGGGISRKITKPADRKRLKQIAGDLNVPDGMGVILRTAGATRTKAEIKRDFEYLMRLWENVRELALDSTAPSLVYEEGSLIKRSIRDLYNKDIDQVLVSGEAGYREAKGFMRMLMPSHSKNVQPYRDATPIFTRFGVEAQLDAMFSPQVTLKSGGYIVINQTEALVSIDVNSGKATREQNIEDTAHATNLEAAEEIARQLRLRDLAGLVVIDFIDMEESRNNRSVERKLKECLKSDRARIQVGRISHFGLLEMSRQRIRTGVLESSSVICPHCHGSGMVRSVESVALHILRSLEDHLLRDSSHNINVHTPVDVALYILNQKRGHLTDLELRFGLTIAVLADDSIAGQHYSFERGEPAKLVYRPKALSPTIQPDSLTPAELEMIEQPVEVEEDEVEAEEIRDSDDGDNRDRRRRRRRRRRRGKHGDEGMDAENGSADEEADGEKTEVSAEATENGDAEASEEGASDEASSDDDDDQGDDRRRRRRRGRRGGRRSRRTGREEMDGSEAQDADGEAQEGEAVAAPEAAEAPSEPVVAEAAAEASETSPAPEAPAVEVEAPAVAEEAAKPVEAEEAPAEAPVEPKKPRRRRTTKAEKAAKAAEAAAEETPAPSAAEAVAEAPPVVEAVVEPAVSEPVTAVVAVEAPAEVKAEAPAVKVEEPSASDSVVLVSPEGEVVAIETPSEPSAPAKAEEAPVEAASEDTADEAAKKARPKAPAKPVVTTEKVSQDQTVTVEKEEDSPRSGWWQRRSFF
ncbi:ribonuclease E/G [Rhodobacteraceae bacterium RKSG542]|uniref:Rne/Rng family ribonuclease n=1 Tax=Pseudovibrio flavus TaxID=2529854 RepID=UPI0012BCF783|nr:ribonuclease E/G [Pseudovibrio flavus]MTI17278.1 ribonuclease E/G [Pseudovibrio flavus]